MCLCASTVDNDFGAEISIFVYDHNRKCIACIDDLSICLYCYSFEFSSPALNLIFFSFFGRQCNNFRRSFATFFSANFCKPIVSISSISIPSFQQTFHCIFVRVPRTCRRHWLYMFRCTGVPLISWISPLRIHWGWMNKQAEKEKNLTQSASWLTERMVCK